MKMTSSRDKYIVNLVGVLDDDDVLTTSALMKYVFLISYRDSAESTVSLILSHNESGVLHFAVHLYIS